MNLKDNNTKAEVVRLKFEQGLSDTEISNITGIPRSTLYDFFNKRRGSYDEFWGEYENKVNNGEIKLTTPKILTIDIETSPVLAAVWGLYNQNVGLSMIHKDWYILSYAAKWLDSDEVIYNDKSGSWKNEDDLSLINEIWELLNQADIVIGQNSKRFDVKKINSRFVINGLKPPTSFKQVDTLEIAKRTFGFTSNKLEYMTDKICTRYKKLKHANFAGYELWKECLQGNPLAWDEMQEYNIHDVLATEELYIKLRPWMKNHPNLNLYTDEVSNVCVCGANDWEHSGYHYTSVSKFDKFQCNSCGAEVRGRVNHFSKDKCKSLTMNLV